MDELAFLASNTTEENLLETFAFEELETKLQKTFFFFVTDIPKIS
jgi:hypothetical protein